MNITVLGAGSWGTAFAIHCARMGHCVNLVPRRFEVALELASQKENSTYLPGIPFPSSLAIVEEIAPALLEAELLVLACPTHALSSICEAIKPQVPSSIQAILSLSKGLDRQTLLCPFELIEKHFPEIPVGVLSGPNCAREIAQGLPAASVLAFDDKESLLNHLQKELSNSALRLYRSMDRKGVQLGGVLKNIYAIGAGLCLGLQLGDNALASYLTRALQEMIRIGVALGGSVETFYGLSGLGDFIATSYGSWSRNHQFGLAFAKSIHESQTATHTLEFHLEAAFTHTKGVVEGYPTIQILSEKLAHHNLSTPLLNALKKVFYENMDPLKMIQALQDRPLAAE